MRVGRVSAEQRNHYHYDCDECGNRFDSDRRAAEKRLDRFKKDLCAPCLKKRHDEAKKHQDFRTRDAGMVELACGACGLEWVTTRDSAMTGMRQSDGLIICRECKQDRKLWNNLINVECFQCKATYSVSPDTIRMRPNPDQRLCGSCSRKGYVMTEECKEKLSKANTGYRHTEESIEKIRARSQQDDIKGHLRQYAKERSEGLRPGPNTGITQSVEWVENRMMKLRGQKRTEESCAKMSKSRHAYLEQFGGHLPESTRKKLSEATIRNRMNGICPEKNHKQETYHPLKPQPAFLKPRKRPYVLSSSWESFYARWLDSEPSVVSWTYEAMSIDLPDGKSYLTDFIWEDVDGQVYVIEVKPRRKVERNVDGAQVKLEALTDFCAMMTEETDRLWVGMLVDEGSLEAIGFTI